MSAADTFVTLAIIVGAHGVAGEVRLKLLGEGVDALRAYKVFNDGALSLSKIRENKGGAIARFTEIPDRNAAERMRGTELAVARSALPPLPDDEYYYCDLIGLQVVTTQGENIGCIVAVENFGAGDVLEIERPEGKRFMVPMNQNAVPGWSEKGVTLAPEFVQ